MAGLSLIGYLWYRTQEFRAGYSELYACYQRKVFFISGSLKGNP